MIEDYAELEFEVSKLVNQRLYTNFLDIFDNYFKNNTFPSIKEINQPTFFDRYKFIDKYGFCIPTLELINELKVLPNDWISIGCGTGFMESILLKNEINVKCYDNTNITENPYFSANPFPINYIEIINKPALDVVKENQSSNVILSWPCYGKDWAEQAVDKIKIGNYLLYIGEGYHGHTGNDGLHQLLDYKFEFIGLLTIGNFVDIFDKAYLYKRKLY